MSDFNCPYCGCGYENHTDLYEHFINDEDEAEMDCKSCKRTMILMREIIPIYTSYRIEEDLKSKARDYRNTLKNWPENTSRLSWLKKEIQRLGEIVRENRAMGGESNHDAS